MADRFITTDKPPYRDPFVDRVGRMSTTWMKWWNRLMLTMSAISVRMNSVTLPNQATSLSATDFANYALIPGLYHVSYYARVTTPAATSSSLEVTVGWFDGGVAQSYTGAAITGNTTDSQLSEVKLIRVDKNSPVTYATTYSTVGLTDMIYRLDLTLERIVGE